MKDCLFSAACPFHNFSDPKNITPRSPPPSSPKKSQQNKTKNTISDWPKARIQRPSKFFWVLFLKQLASTLFPPLLKPHLTDPRLKTNLKTSFRRFIINSKSLSKHYIPNRNVRMSTTQTRKISKNSKRRTTYTSPARDGAVVRALASHQCGPGSNPGVHAICGLSLFLVLSFAPRGFSPGTPVFPSPQKPTLHSNSIWNARTRLNEFIWTLRRFVGKKAKQLAIKALNSASYNKTHKHGSPLITSVTPTPTHKKPRLIEDLPTKWIPSLCPKKLPRVKHVSAHILPFHQDPQNRPR